MNEADRLDAALESDLAAFAASPDVRAMIETGGEIGEALDAWELGPGVRERIYARAIAGSRSRGVAARLRSLGLDRRVQAVAGGTVVTIAAAAVGVAVTRGRRHSDASAA
ncbi:MAG TPA: hypothetical protein VMU65_11010 [Candidatus Saccharimonadales bacterium]|nr:hypothetical protein [Candidatus Saccharimonadales bacterium]